MKLFFETAAQANVFLAMIPVGITAALLIDLAAHLSVLRPLWDVLILLLLGAALGFGIVLLGDTGLRIYHLLAVLSGALLYLTGIRALLRKVVGILGGLVERHRGRN